MPSFTFEQYRSQVDLLRMVLGNALNDISTLHRGIKLIYNIDFSILFPYIFSDDVEGASRFLTSRTRIFRTLVDYQNHKVGFLLGFTGPSFLELLDNLEHRRGHLNYTLAQLSKMCDQWSTITTEKMPDLLANSDKIVQELNGLLKSGPDSLEINSSVKILKHLIQDKILLPMGDIIGNEDRIHLKEVYFPNYQTILQNLTRARLPWDARSKEDAIFHYKVDSLNTVLSPALNSHHSDTDLLFATPQKENLEQCRLNNDSFGRHPFVPMFILNAHILQEEGYVKNSEKFLKDAFITANRIFDDMSGLNSFQEMKSADLNELLHFFRSYVNPLTREVTTKIAGTVSDGKPTKEQLIHTLENAGKIRDLSSKVDVHIAKIANELANACGIQDGLAELFGLTDDPIVKKVKTNLKLY